MPYQTIEFTQDGKLSIIKLNRPNQLNALNEPLLKELTTLIKELAADQSVGGILLTGNGRGFCAGADLGEVNMDKDPLKMAAQGEASYQSMIQYFNPIIQAIHDMEKPVIAAVNGVAAGYGVSLALVCDMVFAAESASFIQVFVPQLGIVPDGGATWLLPRLVTNARAKGMILTGKKIKAQQAEDWGMIWQCLPDETLYDTAFKMAHQLAHGPTLGIGSVKLALNHSDSSTLEKQLRLEAYLQKNCCGSEDFAEGALAFAQKRKPNFSGK